MTATARAMEHATPQDFCTYFLSHMADLYQLAYLVAGDKEHAEDVFVAALEECTEGSPVFRGWEGSWARRSIIKHAVQRTFPGENRGESKRQIVRDPDGLPQLDASLL